MSASFAFVVEGIETIREFDKLSPDIKMAAQRAVNSTLGWTRTDASKRMREEINFPGSYVSSSQGRFAVTRFAKPGQLEGTITARGRATSLARFAGSATVKGSRKKGGVAVEVKPGKVTFMKRAFLIPLKSGAGTTDSRGNLGLAIRLPPGRRLNKKISGKQIFPGVYLLYGPSVYQAFLTLQKDIVPASADHLVDEFDRLREVRF